MISDRELEAFLATPVAKVEALIPISGALELQAGWTLQQVLDAGLYAEQDTDRLVVIREGTQITLVSTVEELRTRRLPMSWFGLLNESLTGAQFSLTVPGSLSLGELCRLAHAERGIDWYLVVNDGEQPVGALSREALARSVPAPTSAEGESCLGVRGITCGLLAVHSRQVVYFWCPREQRCFMPWQIRMGASGQRLCPQGHEVERRTA